MDEACQRTVFTNYQITVSPGNQVIKLDDTTLEEYMVEGLTNDQEYKFDVVCIYPMGNSVSAEAVATRELFIR